MEESGRYVARKTVEFPLVDDDITENDEVFRVVLERDSATPIFVDPGDFTELEFTLLASDVRAVDDTVLPPGNIEFWSALLTVGGTDEVTGFLSNDGDLSSKTISYKGREYDVVDLSLEPTRGRLFFSVSRTTPLFESAPRDGCDEFPTENWTLHVGGETLEFADAAENFGTVGCVWIASDHNVSWSIGDTITVKLSTSEPGRPQALRAEPGVEAVVLRWGAPIRPGGSAITGYQYRQKRGTDEYGEWTDIPDSANKRSYRIGGLGAGVITGFQYATTFQVRAVNDSGGGFESNEAKATPLVAPVDPPMTSLDFWSAVLTVGGSDVATGVFTNDGDLTNRVVSYEGKRYEITSIRLDTRAFDFHVSGATPLFALGPVEGVTSLRPQTGRSTSAARRWTLRTPKAAGQLVVYGWRPTTT